MALKSNFFKANTSTDRAMSISVMRGGNMDFSNTNARSLSSYYAGAGNIPTGTKGQEGAIPSSGQISMSNFYEVQKFNYISTIRSNSYPTIQNFPVVAADTITAFPRKKIIATTGKTTGNNYLQLYRTFDNLSTSLFLGAKINLNSVNYGITPIKILNDASSTYSYVVCSTNKESQQSNIVLVKIGADLGTAPVYVKNFSIFDFSESYDVTVTDAVLGLSSDSVDTIAIVGKTTLLNYTNPRGFILYVKLDGSAQTLIRYPVDTILSGITYYNQKFFVVGTHLYSGSETCRFVSSCNYNFSTYVNTTDWERAYYRGNTDDKSIDDAKITYNVWTSKLNIAGSFATWVYDLFFDSYLYDGRTIHFLQIDPNDQSVSWSKYLGTKPTSSSLSFPSITYSVNGFQYNGGVSDDEDLDFFASASFASQSGTSVGYYRMTNDGLFRARSSFYQNSFSYRNYSGTTIVPNITTKGFEFISSINTADSTGNNFTGLIRLAPDLGVNYGNANNILIGSTLFTYNTLGFKTSPSSASLTTYSLTPASLSLTKSFGVANPSDISNTYTTIFNSELFYSSIYKFNNF